MKTIKILATLLFFFSCFAAYGQIGKITGKWYTIEETGAKKSLVTIYRAPDGTYEGKIEKLLTGDPNRRCVNCTGADKDKPLIGMKIIKGMKADGQKLSKGTILDPNNGKIYSCTISYDSKNAKLKVKGSLDKTGLLGRTQIWEPAGLVN
ncbi:MAG: DUF2147 domain-containing protein [Bacteroidales bacterium]|nr:DUF2147 domain-containing protein [Bacteroidales bacterium]MDD2425785.1 DUF2147 domain-containing protein [Bacteroidales bacterium]MDD3990103.1 DUF2147 domain-containing protein [Bacteroidales bacterium]MDD4638696.1 DUF2147 domain-containing protein [Bacteroidales bacterium]